jgi:hypothetical protein
MATAMAMAMAMAIVLVPFLQVQKNPHKAGF